MSWTGRVNYRRSAGHERARDKPVVPQCGHLHLADPVNGGCNLLTQVSIARSGRGTEAK
jgi:hypothetical protein